MISIPLGLKPIGYLKNMSGETLKLIPEFEALPMPEKQAFANGILRRLPPFDSGPLDDELVAAAGDQTSARLDEAEHGAPTR